MVIMGILLSVTMFYLGYKTGYEEHKTKNLECWAYGTWHKGGTHYDIQEPYYKMDSIMIGKNVVIMTISYKESVIEWSLEKKINYKN